MNGCRNFNTSHVTVYQLRAVLERHKKNHFNTSHVTVYPLSCVKWNNVPSFQYIPCYCLSQLFPHIQARLFISIHPMLLFIGKYLFERDGKRYFNTSHVTVYPGFKPFGYKVFIISIHPMLLFIKRAKNTCCYPMRISIHPMLLFIMAGKFIDVTLRYFNTSHVTVYPLLMLPPLRSFLFQYIPCYCLSDLPMDDRRKLFNFNTSHVTVYPIRAIEATRNLEFQYIPCYCLSRATSSKNIPASDFNTSHVTVYPDGK